MSHSSKLLDMEPERAMGTPKFVTDLQEGGPWDVWPVSEVGDRALDPVGPEAHSGKLGSELSRMAGHPTGIRGLGSAQQWSF